MFSAKSMSGVKMVEGARFSPAYFWMWNDKLDEAKLIAQLDGKAFSGKVVYRIEFESRKRARIKAAHKPHPLYEKYHGLADRQNRESGLFGPVVLLRDSCVDFAARGVVYGRISDIRKG